MDSVKKTSKGTILIILAIAILSFHSGVTEGKSLFGRELHPIDICIFSCDMCYKGEALVNCANECIVTEANMGPTWIRTCRLFAGDAFHGIPHEGVMP